MHGLDLSNMTTDQIINYESLTYRYLKDTTASYIKFIKNNYYPSLEHFYSEPQSSIFSRLMDIWGYMERNNISHPDRFPQKFLLTVCLIKTKKGY